MSMDKDKIEEQIANAIRRVGSECDVQDVETLRRFVREVNENSQKVMASACHQREKQTEKRKAKSFGKKLLIGFTSMAAIIVLALSLNIYLEYQQMDKAFTVYYSPLEYDSVLSSRGAVTLSPELSVVMEAYNQKDYPKALQLFENIPHADKDYLIYKAISLIETEQLLEAITLLEDLVKDGESTTYYQDANWYLANAYLKNHDKKKALEILSGIEQSDGVYADKAKELINMLQ